MYDFISRVVALTHVEAYLVNTANYGQAGYSCGVDVVDNFVTGEETEEIIVGLECVDSGKNMLEVNCVVRVCRIVSIKRIGRCVDYDISYASFG